MRFLSQEEQECLQFFEETIDSLEESLVENDLTTRQLNPTTRRGLVEVVNGPVTSSPNPGVILARPPSPKDQDIIDLVRPEPDLVQTKEPIFSPPSPGSVQQLVLLCTAIARILETLFLLRMARNKMVYSFSDFHFALCSSQIFRVKCGPLKATTRQSQGVIRWTDCLQSTTLPYQVAAMGWQTAIPPTTLQVVSLRQS